MDPSLPEQPQVTRPSALVVTMANQKPPEEDTGEPYVPETVDSAPAVPSAPFAPPQPVPSVVANSPTIPKTEAEMLDAERAAPVAPDTPTTVKRRRSGVRTIGRVYICVYPHCRARVRKLVYPHGSSYHYGCRDHKDTKKHVWYTDYRMDNSIERRKPTEEEEDHLAQYVLEKFYDHSDIPEPPSDGVRNYWHRMVAEKLMLQKKRMMFKNAEEHSLAVTVTPTRPKPKFKSEMKAILDRQAPLPLKLQYKRGGSRSPFIPSPDAKKHRSKAEVFLALSLRPDEESPQEVERKFQQLYAAKFPEDDELAPTSIRARMVGHPLVPGPVMVDAPPPMEDPSPSEVSADLPHDQPL